MPSSLGSREVVCVKKTERALVGNYFSVVVNTASFKNYASILVLLGCSFRHSCNYTRFLVMPSIQYKTGASKTGEPVLRP
jgi:hypothetical protein